MTLREIRLIIRNIIVEQVATDLVKAETNRVLESAIPKIEKYISEYKDCKIGKSAVVEKRLDTWYKRQGYIGLIEIEQCAYKQSMDEVEIELIKYFGDFVENKTKKKGGNRSYTDEYWIYIVHKGKNA